MRQQVAQRHIASTFTGSAAHHKPRQQLAQGSVQVEQAALVEQHGPGRSGCHLGEAGHVVDGLHAHSGRAFVIGKAAQRILEHGFAAVHHAKGAAGEGAAGDRIVQHPVNGGKPVAGGGRRSDF